MKNKLDKIIEELVEEMEDVAYNKPLGYFIKKAIQEVLEDLKDNNSLSDESNGRYNREKEYRQKAKNNWGVKL